MKVVSNIVKAIYNTTVPAIERKLTAIKCDEL